jgi:hypothetical protein
VRFLHDSNRTMPLEEIQTLMVWKAYANGIELRGKLLE